MIGTWLRRIGVFVVSLIAVMGLILLLGPRENVKMPTTPLDLGDDPDLYLQTQEARFDDLTPDTQKQIVWAGQKGEKTNIALVYLHGFSATHYETRPLPQNIAKELDANLYLSRLAGHGQPGEALAEASAQDWLNDLREAVLIGQALGEKTVLLTTSTGGTLAAIGAIEPSLQEDIDAIIFISPNFAINNPMAPLLTLGAARHWVPLLAGQERNWEPVNEAQGRYWTTSYPSTAVFPVAALVRETQSRPYEETDIPALFYFSQEDQVVDANVTTEVSNQWGGEVMVVNPELTEADDPYKHVIAGDILSPEQTKNAQEVMVNWIKDTLE